MPSAKSSPERRPHEAAAHREIGFIGVGLMGGPMCRVLLKRLSTIRLHLIRGRDSKTEIKKLKPASRLVWHDTPAQLAAAVRNCFTMLPGPNEVQEVVLGGADSLIHGLGTGAAVIDCTTSSATLARQMDEQLATIGAGAIDAPVSGAPIRAAEGTLSLMCGGRREVFRDVLPLLSVLGVPTYMGPPGCGQITKYINQIIVGLIMAAIGEGIILGRAAGIDLKAMLKAVGGGLAGTEVMRIKGPNMIAGKFEPGGFVKYHLKDLNLALETARAHGLSLPFTELIREYFRKAVDLGRGEIDHSGVMTVIETLNGLDASKR